MPALPGLNPTSSDGKSALTRAVVAHPVRQRSSLRQPDSNRNPTTVADRGAQFVAFGHTQQVFAVWKPIAHPTWEWVPRRHHLRVAAEVRRREPNATIVTGSSFQHELQTSYGAHDANVALARSCWQDSHPDSPAQRPHSKDRPSLASAFAISGSTSRTIAFQ